MTSKNYVQMPQDDMKQILLVAREYSCDPAKGLAHGVQKDAIQNGWGARATVPEVAACREWTMFFELIKIKGTDALVFWDEGTVGLTGEILSANDMNKAVEAGTLGPKQRLSRFLTRFVSGTNIGPGMFGRGKLVFHAASDTTKILIDSLRKPDGQYIALDRWVDGRRLMQPEIPLTGIEAQRFIVKQTENVLQPLTKPGTRITILNLKPEIVESFRLSFSDSNSAYKKSMAHMIEETWWEPIHKFDANIILRYDGEERRVELRNPLLGILNAEDGQDGMRVHRRENIVVTVGSNFYRIKELFLAVGPENIEEEFRDIWVQRKRMKIGSIAKYIDLHPKVAKRLAGYIILEPDLEKLVEEAEAITHYGFDLRSNGVKQIRETLRAELNEFQRRLGLISQSADAVSRERLLDSMKKLNELAPELGLITQQSMGSPKSDVRIMLKGMQLPESATLRVEMGDQIGPIKYQVANSTHNIIAGTFRVTAKQHGRDTVALCSQRKDLEANSKVSVIIPPFEMGRDFFENGKAVKIEAVYVRLGSTEVLARCGRTLYLGMEPPVSPKPPVSLSVACTFPHRNTRRVEISEVIKDILVRGTNNTLYEFVVDLTITVRQLANPRIERATIPLFSLLEMRDLVLGPQQDFEVLIGDLLVSPEKFALVHQAVADISERTCDVFTVIRLARKSAELNKPRKWKLNKNSIRFYLGVDPPGRSIFTDLQAADEPSDGRQSWYMGDIEGGYIFILNSGHAGYRFVQSRDDSPIIKRYEQEQMLRQAYLIAFENEIFKGPAEPWEDSLMTGGIPPKEIAKIFDTIIGTAIARL